MLMTAEARVDRVSVQARAVDVRAVLGRAVLTVLAAVLWCVGALPGAALRGMVWAVVAVRVGYRDGRGLNGGAGYDRPGG